MIEEWNQFQIEKSNELILYDDIDFTKIKLVAGLDISFDKVNNNRACAYITIHDITTGRIIYEDHEIIEMIIPYISGYLGFREVPAYLCLLEKIKNTSLRPELLLVDGFGILHKNKFGSASHLSYMTGIPSIGIGKTLLCFDGLNEKKIKDEFKLKCKNKGEYILLKGNSDYIYGAALKSTKDCINPIYISIGNKISLNTAVNIVTRLSLYRIPEPIRNSDIKSKIYF